MIDYSYEEAVGYPYNYKEDIVDYNKKFSRILMKFQIFVESLKED